MTEDRDFKELVRTRMARTGESYSTARMNVLRSHAQSEAKPDLPSATPAGPGPERRRLLEISAEGHATVELAPEGGGDGGFIADAGLTVRSSSRLEEIRVDAHRIRIVTEGSVTVGLLQPRFDLEIEAEGHVRVSDLDGRVDVSTSDGHVALSGRIINPSVETGDGDITIDGGQGSVSVSTGDGNIRLSGDFSDLDIETGDGNVTVEGGRGNARVTTGDGHIRLTGGFGDVDVETGDGDIFIQSLASGTVSSCDGRVELVLADGVEPRIEVMAERVTGDLRFIGREDMWVTGPDTAGCGLIRVETDGLVVVHRGDVR